MGRLIIHTLCKHEPDFAESSTHPTETGYEKMAAVWHRKLWSPVACGYYS